MSEKIVLVGVPSESADEEEARLLQAFALARARETPLVAYYDDTDREARLASLRRARNSWPYTASDDPSSTATSVPVNGFAIDTSLPFSPSSLLVVDSMSAQPTSKPPKPTCRGVAKRRAKERARSKAARKARKATR